MVRSHVRDSARVSSGLREPLRDAGVFGSLVRDSARVSSGLREALRDAGVDRSLVRDSARISSGISEPLRDADVVASLVLDSARRAVGAFPLSSFRDLDFEDCWRATGGWGSVVRLGFRVGRARDDSRDRFWGGMLPGFTGADMGTESSVYPGMSVAPATLKIGSCLATRGGVGGPALSSDDPHRPESSQGNDWVMETKDGTSKRTGYWSMVPLAQTPSTPGFSPSMVSPYNSRERDSASSSTDGEGGHRGRLRQNGMVCGVWMIR